MIDRMKYLGAGILALLLISGLPGDEKRASPHAEIAAKTLASLAAACNAHKASEVADLFTPTGEFVDGEANVFHGREAIAREFGALFKLNPQRKLELAPDDTREISPGLLTVDGTARIIDEKNDDNQEIEFVALIVRQSDGQWLLASVRSLGEDEDESPRSHLQRLSWLIGEWVDESDESTMHMTTRWSKDKNFILSDFEIHVAGSKVMSGTQRIGWDGALEKFKSWVFDSEGGHAEGIWTELDDGWVVSSTGVNSDGDACSATHTYELRGSDAFLFSVTERNISGEAADDFTSRVVRKPPEPEKAQAGSLRAK